MTPRRRAALAAAALVVAACGSGGAAGESAPPSPTTAPADPARGSGTVTVTLDQAAAISLEMGQDGGVLSTTSTAGVTFILEVPAGALLSPKTITMTPIASASGDPLGDAPVAAVHLAPEGLHFLRPVTITASGSGVTDAIGFSAAGDGTEFHLIPAREGGTGSVAATTHFSLVGFGAREQLADAADRYRPTTAEAVATAAVVLAGDDFDAAYTALLVWASLIADGLAGAGGTIQLEQVTVEMLSFYMRLDETLTRQEAISGAPSLPSDLATAAQSLLDLWFVKVGEEVTRLGGFCSTDPASAFRVYRWVLIGAALSDLLGVDRSDVLSTWAEQASACLTFEVAWAAAVELTDSSGMQALTLASVIATVSGPVEFDAAMSQLTGALAVTDAPYVMEKFEFKDCTPVATDGVARVGLTLDVTLENPPSAASVEVENLLVALDGNQPPRVQCEELIAVGSTTEWAGWFFTIPVSLMNADRLVLDGAWGFSVEVTATSGEMGVLELEESDVREGTTAFVAQVVAVTHTGS